MENITNSLCDTCKDNDICKDVGYRKTCGAYKAKLNQQKTMIGRAQEIFEVTKE